MPTFPLNDDWAYSWAVRNWIESGSLRLSQWGSPTLLFQVLWGRLFCLPFGFSFEALRVSTLALALAGLLAFHDALLKLGASPRSALAGSLTLLFNPLFFALGHSFMTDVPALSLMLLSGWALVAGRTALGAGFSALAYLVRQTGPLPALAFALWKPRRAWLLLGLPLAAVAGHALWLRAAGSSFAFRTYLVSGTLAHLSRPGPLILDALGRLAGASLYLGMFLFPWAAGRPKGRGSWVSAAVVGGLWLAVLGLHAIPATGNVVGRFGLGTCTPGDCPAKGSGIFAKAWFWAAATLAAPAALAYLCRSLRIGRTGPYALGFCLAFAAALAGKDHYDRYFLPLFPAFIALLATNLEIRWRSFAPLLLPLLLWSALGTWDGLAWNAARWRAGERLHAAGVPYERIEGGLDWDAYHAYEDRMRELLKAKPASAIRWDQWLDGAKFEAFVSFSPAGAEGAEPYWSPLTGKREYLYFRTGR